MDFTIRPFDAVNYLDSEEMMVEYLNATLEKNDTALFLVALSDIARARGMTNFATETGLTRKSLYKSLCPGAKPRFETIQKILGALNVRFLAVQPLCNTMRI